MFIIIEATKRVSRDYPFVKVFLITAIMGAMVTALVNGSGRPIDWTHAWTLSLVLGCFFLIAFAIALLPEIREIKKQRETKDNIIH